MEAMEQHKQHLIISSSITFLILSFNFLPLLPMSSYFSHSPLSNIPPSVHSYTACIFPRSPQIISSPTDSSIARALWEICSYVLRNNFGDEANMLSTYGAVSAEFFNCASQLYSAPVFSLPNRGQHYLELNVTEHTISHTQAHTQMNTHRK